jgi:RNA polymerase sigma factor (sigma-70 family)
MPTETSVQIQGLLTRLHDGDADALAPLAARAYERLRRLAGGLLRHGFPAVEAQHELDSVLHEAWPRIFRAVEHTKPSTVADFTRLAAHKIRQVLLDLADRKRRRDRRERPWPSDGPDPHPESWRRESALYDAARDTDDPETLARWTEVHRAVESLPEAERRVFEACYYLGLTQVEAASLLVLHPRQVSRLWVAATARLADRVFGPDDSGDFRGRPV